METIHEPMHETQPVVSRGHGVTERDLRWTLIAAEIELLLFKALQADALGTIEHLTHADLNPRLHGSVCALLALRSEQAVRSISTVAVSEAKRKTLLKLRALMDECERNAVFANSDTIEDRAVARRAIQSFRRMLDGCSGELNVAEWLIEAYDKALVEPLTLSERAQQGRVALRIAESDGGL